MGPSGENHGKSESGGGVDGGVQLEQGHAWAMTRVGGAESFGAAGSLRESLWIDID
jgi:hypothetical protein